jgi:hypothetical protein
MNIVVFRHSIIRRNNDTKVVIRIRESKKDRQHSCQKKGQKDNNLQNITHKDKDKTCN